MPLTKVDPPRASLAAALDCNSCLLGLQITNGTEWLQIGGRDDTFLPIVIKESQVNKNISPPFHCCRRKVAATSDLSLDSALAAFNEKQGSSSRFHSGENRQSALSCNLVTVRLAHLFLDAVDPGILVARHRLHLPPTSPAIPSPHISW